MTVNLLIECISEEISLMKDDSLINKPSIRIDRSKYKYNHHRERQNIQTID